MRMEPGLLAISAFPRLLFPPCKAFPLSPLSVFARFVPPHYQPISLCCPGPQVASLPSHSPCTLYTPFLPLPLPSLCPCHPPRALSSGRRGGAETSPLTPQPGRCSTQRLHSGSSHSFLSLFPLPKTGTRVTSQCLSAPGSHHASVLLSTQDV